MGYTKRLIERWGDCNLGAYQDHYVCPECVADVGLRTFIDQNLKSKCCSFCHSKTATPKAAPFTEIVLYIDQCLGHNYSTAEAKLPYEGREGGFVGDVMNTWEIVERHLELPLDESGELFEALCDGLGERNWCNISPFVLAADERLIFSWQEFSRLIKHHRRFFFLNQESHDEEFYSTFDLFKKLRQSCEDLSIVRTLPADLTLYRARFQECGERFETAKDLGPPPQEKALNSYRMSPPGIVMFYLSEDPDTALREISEKQGSFAIGQFEFIREVSILDLAQIPSIPSIFEEIPDSLEFDPRPVTKFLTYFAEDLSKPIDRSDRPHIEYIPTQVITEYFRTRQPCGSAAIDGIRYRSARHSGKCSLVLFATQEDLVDGWKNPLDRSSADYNPWIKLAGVTNHEVTQEQCAQWKRERSLKDDAPSRMDSAL